MLIKGEDFDKIVFGFILLKDGFFQLKFDFMFFNLFYGKLWKVDKESIVDKKDIIDDCFKVGILRSFDGQLLFLMNMVVKMKENLEFGF